MHIQRELTQKLLEASKKFGVVLVTGPRQSGKTTLVKHVFPNYEYINLEDPITLRRVTEDPRAVIKSGGSGIIIDEVQKYPELLSFIQVAIDQDFKPGRFILTGSQNILMSHKVSQSLAGRVAVLTLFPLTLSEMAKADLINLDPKTFNTNTLMLEGFYPGKIVRNISRHLFYSSYLETYIERDVRSLRNIGDLVNFRRFLSLLAGRVGQLVDYSSLASDVGVSHKTISNWISVLEASYVVFRLPPYFRNFGKRVIKSPKVYFWDTGLVTYLLEIDSATDLDKHFAIGGLFENLVIADFFKRKHHLMASSHLYFWRSKTQKEVDLLITSGNRTLLAEIKAAYSFDFELVKNLDYYLSLAKDEDIESYLIYRGESLGEVKQHKVVNVADIVEIQNRWWSMA